MLSKDCIKEYIENLVINFPEIKATYFFDSDNNSHVIKILPQKFYSENVKYQNFEDELTYSFIKKFPFENICFITEGDDYILDRIDYELFGRNYITPNLTVNQFMTIETPIFNNIDFLLNNYRSNINNRLITYSKFDLNSHFVNVNSITFLLNEILKKSKPSDLEYSSIVTFNKNTPDELINTSEGTYPLAA
jgi:hypothetical protein